MMDAIARSGSFAAAARELGKVPSALTYSVRQLEDALDVLLFDRRSRQAHAHRRRRGAARRRPAPARARSTRSPTACKRVATGWETQLTIAVDDVDLARRRCSSCARRSTPAAAATTPRGAPATAPPATRLRLRTEVLAGTWEALVTGQADLAIGVAGELANCRAGIEMTAARRRCPSCSPSRRTIRWPPPTEPLGDAELCAIAPSRWPIRRSA